MSHSSTRSSSKRNISLSVFDTSVREVSAHTLIETFPQEDFLQDRLKRVSESIDELTEAVVFHLVLEEWPDAQRSFAEHSALSWALWQATRSPIYAPDRSFHLSLFGDGDGNACWYGAAVAPADDDDVAHSLALTTAQEHLARFRAENPLPEATSDSPEMVTRPEPVDIQLVMTLGKHRDDETARKALEEGLPVRERRERIPKDIPAVRAFIHAHGGYPVTVLAGRDVEVFISELKRLIREEKCKSRHAFRRAIKKERARLLFPPNEQIDRFLKLCAGLSPTHFYVSDEYDDEHGDWWIQEIIASPYPYGPSTVDGLSDGGTIAFRTPSPEALLESLIKDYSVPGRY